MATYFNKNLPYIRKKRKISQLDLAKKIGVDQSTISLWENGMDITIDNAIKVANALNIPYPEFLGTDLTIEEEIDENKEDPKPNHLEKYRFLLDSDDRLTKEEKELFYKFLEEKHKEIDEKLNK